MIMMLRKNCFVCFSPPATSSSGSSRRRNRSTSGSEMNERENERARELRLICSLRVSVYQAFARENVNARVQVVKILLIPQAAMPALTTSSHNTIFILNSLNIDVKAEASASERAKKEYEIFCQLTAHSSSGVHLLLVIIIFTHERHD
jgi:hypothetical protein